MHDTLAFTTLTASGQVYDIDFPLHPGTRSSEGVSDLLTAVLASISETLEGRHDISDGDVLQSLAMALAIRSQMAGGGSDSMANFVVEFYREAYDAVRKASIYPAGLA